MTKETNTIESEVVEPTQATATTKETRCDKNSETFSRVFYTILFGVIGWITVWVFCCVVLIQFGFLLITGKVNNNLKEFNKEIGLFLFDMIKYLSFQTNEKPFPFRDWPYDESEKKAEKVEPSSNDTVEVSK
jgi:hypothetical protein